MPKQKEQSQSGLLFPSVPNTVFLEQRQVELAWEEARTLSPKPAILVFAAFEFDPEAAKDIDGMTKEKTGMTFLTAQMNADLLTEDLKKKRASNQSFWLVGRPDIDLRKITRAITKASGKSRYRVSTTTTPEREPSNQATRRRSPCGCWIRTTTAAVCTRGKCFSHGRRGRWLGAAGTEPESGNRSRVDRSAIARPSPFHLNRATTSVSQSNSSTTGELRASRSSR